MNNYGIRELTLVLSELRDLGCIVDEQLDDFQDANDAYDVLCVASKRIERLYDRINRMIKEENKEMVSNTIPIDEYMEERDSFLRKWIVSLRKMNEDDIHELGFYVAHNKENTDNSGEYTSDMANLRGKIKDSEMKITILRRVLMELMKDKEDSGENS